MTGKELNSLCALICTKAENALTSRSDEDYIDACERIESWFEGSAEAKREELRREVKSDVG